MRKVVLSQFEKEKLTYLQKYSDNSVERNRSLYDRDNGDINIARNKGWSFVNYR